MKILSIYELSLLSIIHFSSFSKKKDEKISFGFDINLLKKPCSFSDSDLFISFFINLNLIGFKFFPLLSYNF
jgi:hypothetical protein